MRSKNWRFSEKLIWLFILAASVLLRVGVALYLGDMVDAPPLMTDQRSYHALGARLVQGYGYSFDRGWYPFTLPNTPTAFWSFLYPLFVAAVYAVFGVHPLAVRLVQAVLGGILLPWMVYRLARRLTLTAHGTPPVGGAVSREGLEQGAGWGWQGLPLLAAALCVIYGYFILYAATLMTETFYIVAVLWSLETGLRLGARLREGHSVPWRLALELGLSLAVSTLLRQSFLPWVPLFFLWLLVEAFTRSNVSTFGRSNVLTTGWAALRSLILAGLVLVLGILPWTIRNYRVYGRFLLLNSNTGYAMYSAQHPMHGVSFHEFEAAPLPPDLKGTNEAEWDRELLRIGLQYVRDDPWRYLRLCLSRARAYFEFWPTPDTVPLHNIGRTASFGLFLPFMLYGLYLSLRRWPSQGDPLRPWGLGLLYLFMVFYPLLHILTWAMVRYRLPVDALGLIFAALALHDLYIRVRRWLALRASARMASRSRAGE